jgi:hypothetical protein
MNSKEILKGLLKNVGWKIAVVAVAAIAVVLMLWRTVRAVEQTEVSIDVDNKINITPEQIKSIKDIGEWEFLAIADEELVDTMRKGIFTDDHLVRIYYGTIRLGINMRQTSPGWIETVGDSISVTLPNIILLDRDFIDEARTQSFHESGHWSAREREALYNKAHRLMLNRCMTTENKETARKNGEVQFRRMMRAMGYERVGIRWEE